jgi:hypothetical protein
MAQLLSRTVFLLAAFVLLLAAQRSDAQSSGQPSPPPAAEKPKPPEPTPAAKELSAQEIDLLTQMAFGKDSPEMTRPIRVWIHYIGMVIAAEKATVAPNDGSIRFTSVSIGLPLESQVLSGEQAIVVADRPVTQWSELKNRSVISIEVRCKNSVVMLTPSRDTTFTTVEEKGGVQPQPTAPMGGKLEPAPERIFAGERPRQSMLMRFKFNIEPKSSLTELLPALPTASAKLPLWTNEDLARVTELTFGEPISKSLAKHQAMEATAHVVAKVNHLNRGKTDGFMLAMIEQRHDLRGLPFLMGDECRTREEQAKIFAMVVEVVRQAVPRAKDKEDGLIEEVAEFWTEVSKITSHIQQGDVKGGKARIPRVNQECLHRATVAALVQILMPESEQFRIGLAKHLAIVPHIDATKALAKLAIFSPEYEVRAAAIEGLKLRRRGC